MKLDYVYSFQVRPLQNYWDAKLLAQGNQNLKSHTISNFLQEFKINCGNELRNTLFFCYKQTRPGKTDPISEIQTERSELIPDPTSKIGSPETWIDPNQTILDAKFSRMLLIFSWQAH